MWKISLKVTKQLGKLLPPRPTAGPNSDDDSKDEVSLPTIHVGRRDANQLDSSSHSDGSEDQSLPMVYALARRWAWIAVSFRCQTHPHEADSTFKDHKGDTAMHWTCFGNPPIDTVTTLLDACPSLASTPNDLGCLPLHFACSYRASPKVIRALVQAYPEGAGIETHSGDSPLHLLCSHGGAVDSFRAVLESPFAHSTLSMLDRVFCRTPLALLSARKSMHAFHTDLMKLRHERRRQQALQAEGADLGKEDVLSFQEILNQCESSQFWQKACLLVQTEYRRACPGVGLERIRMVHACLGSPQCPDTLLEFALLLYPDQLLERDENGRIPLHIAADGESSTVDALRDVVQACPVAAHVRDDRGRLAIEMAIQRKLQWNEGMSQLLAAYPVSLESLDLDERLYPYVWSRFRHDPRIGMHGLFESVRARPHMFRNR